MTAEQINEKIDDVDTSHIDYNYNLRVAEALEQGFPLLVEFPDGSTYCFSKYEYKISGITENVDGSFCINVKIKEV